MAVARFYDLTTLGPDDLAALAGPDPIMLLVGSGLSIWSPSALPSGKDFTRGTYDALFRSPGHPPLPAADDQWLSDWFDGKHEMLPPLPFEVIMERCPDHSAVGALLSALYGSDRFNALHDAVAKLFASRRVRGIVTTNYDRCLDVRLDVHAPGTSRVVRSGDPAVGPTFFKIHGSAEPGFDDTLVFRLGTEGALPAWKRALLRQMFCARTVLVVGYSGIDFDICPEVRSCGPKRVLWNFLAREEAERSPGLRRLVDEGVAVDVLVGDMRAVLALLGQPVSATLSTSAHDIGAALRGCVPPDSMLLWRARVLNSIGHARLAESALIALPSSVEVVRSFAQAAFHRGAYATSAARFLDASGLASGERDRRLILLDAADATRCHGRLRRASQLVEEASSGIAATEPWADEVRAAADVKRILVLRDLHELARVVGFGTGVRATRRRAATLLEGSARGTLEAGRWFDFQQLSLWAERMGIDPATVRPAGLYAPQPTVPGYRQLAYPVALAMEACDRARLGRSTAIELRFFADLMQAFGCAQYWKVAYALARLDGRRRWTPRFAKSFARCEYTPLARVLCLMRSS